MGNIVKFAKPYSFEGTEYTEVDLSGMDKLTIQDMIDIQKSLANELASLAALEATTSFAQEMATKASGKPVEFFKLMPRAKIKQVQTAILLSLTVVLCPLAVAEHRVESVAMAAEICFPVVGAAARRPRAMAAVVAAARHQKGHY